jgi:dipeptidyl aminopeptidase/acylaminoacyl peptidase
MPEAWFQFARYVFLGILAALFALAIPRARAQARKIELGDFQKIVGVSSPAISPDGKSIVIVVSRVNWDEDRYDSQRALVDIATGAQRRLTNIRKGLDLPQWSPSGDRLEFVAAAGVEKKVVAQVFVLPMNGGEPQQITTAPLGVEQFAWRPDGKDIAYVTSDEPPNCSAALSSEGPAIRIDKNEGRWRVSIIGSTVALLQCSRQVDDPSTDLRPVKSSEAEQQTLPGTASQSEAVKSWRLDSMIFRKGLRLPR